METEKEDFATWFARRKHLFKGDLRDFISSIATPHKKKPGFDWWKNLPEDKKAALSKGLLSEELKTDVLKKDRIDFLDKLTPERKPAFITEFEEEIRTVQRAEKLEHTQKTPEGQNTPHQGTPQTTPGSKDTPGQIKLRRGKKEYYASQTK